jgi:hypothetical protein
MNTATKIILIIVIASLATLTTAVAFGEEYEDRVLLPWEHQLRACGENSDDWVCVWSRTNATEEEVMDQLINGTEAIEDVKEISIAPAEEAEPEPIIAEKPPKLTPFERDLERFEEHPPATNAEQEYHELLKQLALCQRGYDESRGVQATNEFEISYTWVNDGEAWLRALDYTGNHARLKMAIEECQAIRTILNPVILGAEYLHRSPYYNQTQIYHGDLVDDVPQWPASRVLEESNPQLQEQTDDERLENIYCREDSYFSQSTKDIYCKEEIHIETSNGIPVISTALEKRKQYTMDHGESMAEDLRKESLQKHLKRLLNK